MNIQENVLWDRKRIQNKILNPSWPIESHLRKRLCFSTLQSLLWKRWSAILCSSSSIVLDSLSVPWPWEWNFLSDPAPPKQSRSWVVICLSPETEVFTPVPLPQPQWLFTVIFWVTIFWCPCPSCSRVLLLNSFQESSRPGFMPSPQLCLLFCSRQHHQEASFLTQGLLFLCFCFCFFYFLEF